MNKPTILVYKRTHTGDPDGQGLFGHQSCMGRIRDCEYEAVIGIGGTKPWPGDEGIAGRVNWIGIGKIECGEGSDGRAKVIAFKQFLLLDEKGPELADVSQLLYDYMFVGRRRLKLFGADTTDPKLYAALKNVLRLADGALPSPCLGAGNFDSKQSGCRAVAKPKGCGQ